MGRGILCALVPVLYLLAGLYVDVKADSPCPSNATWHNLSTGHCYLLFSYNLSWDLAQDRCVNEGGHLLTLESEQEVEAVSQFLESEAGDDWFHLGLRVVDGGSLFNGTVGIAWVDGALYTKNTKDYLEFSLESELQKFGPAAFQFKPRTNSSKMLVGFSTSRKNSLEVESRFVCKYSENLWCQLGLDSEDTMLLTKNAWANPVSCTAMCLHEGYTGYAVVNPTLSSCSCNNVSQSDAAIVVSNHSIFSESNRHPCNQRCLYDPALTCGGLTNASVVRKLSYHGMNASNSRKLINCEAILASGVLMDFTFNGKECKIPGSLPPADTDCDRYIPEFANTSDNLHEKFEYTNRLTYERFLQRSWKVGSTRSVRCPENLSFNDAKKDGLAVCTANGWEFPSGQCVDSSSVRISDFKVLRKTEDHSNKRPNKFFVGIIAISVGAVLSAMVLFIFLILSKDVPEDMEIEAGGAPNVIQQKSAGIPKAAQPKPKPLPAEVQQIKKEENRVQGKTDNVEPTPNTKQIAESGHSLMKDAVSVLTGDAENFVDSVVDTAYDSKVAAVHVSPNQDAINPNAVSSLPQESNQDGIKLTEGNVVSPTSAADDRTASVADSDDKMTFPTSVADNNKVSPLNSASKSNYEIFMPSSPADEARTESEQIANNDASPTSTPEDNKVSPLTPAFKSDYEMFMPSSSEDGARTESEQIANNDATSASVVDENQVTVTMEPDAL